MATTGCGWLPLNTSLLDTLNMKKFNGIKDNIASYKLLMFSELKEQKQKKKQQQQQLRQEELLVAAAKTWTKDILPNWESM